MGTQSFIGTAGSQAEGEQTKMRDQILQSQQVKQAKNEREQARQQREQTNQLLKQLKKDEQQSKLVRKQQERDEADLGQSSSTNKVESKGTLGKALTDELEQDELLNLAPRVLDEVSDAEDNTMAEQPSTKKEEKIKLVDDTQNGSEQSTNCLSRVCAGPLSFFYHVKHQLLGNVETIGDSHRSESENDSEHDSGRTSPAPAASE